MKKLLMVLAAMLLMATVMCSCGANGDGEAGDRGNVQTDDVGDGGNDTNDNITGDVEKGMDDAGNAVKDGVDSAGNAIKDGVDAVDDALTGDDARDNTNNSAK